MNWSPPLDWITQFKGYVGEITGSFWGITLMIVGFIIAVEIVFFLIELATDRQSVRDDNLFQSIAERHLIVEKGKAIEREMDAFGISDQIKEEATKEAVISADKYREKLKKRWNR